MKLIVVAIVFLALAILLLAFPTSAPAVWIDKQVGFILSGGGIAHPMRQQRAGATSRNDWRLPARLSVAKILISTPCVSASPSRRKT